MGLPIDGPNPTSPLLPPFQGFQFYWKRVQCCGVCLRVPVKLER